VLAHFEETGSMDVLLDKAADYFDEEADSATAQLVGFLEPIVIILMAVIVGFIIIAIMLPMYGMMQYV
jgi:type IV pilus assembly protein PilC